MVDIAINFNLWLAFVLATAVLAIIPGPIVTLVIANSLSQGTRAGVANVMGTVLGNMVLFLIGGLGMAWVLSALSNWFDVLRLAGAVYLVYLGIKSWRSKGQGLEDQEATKPGKSLFLQGVVVAITNPKTIIFYAAFFPQFMDPTLSAPGQLFVLSVTFLAVAAFLDMTYAFLAGRLRPYLLGARRAAIRNKITGVLLIVTGIALAFTRKT
ncbi:LysE family translocator [Kiloniella spongiae]|uniref:LysE family translocator n=1 Tax=Kiloniella spongiae TaxID=1489064 RepID=UPI0006993DDD|nr:LysE family translocator [Kiloniella spongiae]